MTSWSLSELRDLGGFCCISKTEIASPNNEETIFVCLEHKRDGVCSPGVVVRNCIQEHEFTNQVMSIYTRMWAVLNPGIVIWSWR